LIVLGEKPESKDAEIYESCVTCFSSPFHAYLSEYNICLSKCMYPYICFTYPVLSCNRCRPVVKSAGICITLVVP